MNHDEFVEKMTTPMTVDYDECRRIIGRSVEADTTITKCIVAMEELAELQKELSKAARDKLNRYDLIQEIADVEICLLEICSIYGINETAVDKAMWIKLLQERDRLDSLEKADT